MELHQQHGLNVIKLQLATGDRFWFVAGCYLSLDDASSTDRVVRDCEAELMVVGDLNEKIAEKEGKRRDEAIISSLLDAGVNFRQFPPAPHLMSAGRPDMEHAQRGEGGAVPDGLHYWDRHPSVPERLHTGS